MTTLTAPTDGQVRDWRRTLVAHTQVNGRCRVCGTRRRCWTWAFAFGDLLAHGIDPSTPAQATGGRPADGGSEGEPR